MFRHSLVLLFVVLLALTADARDSLQEFSIEAAMNQSRAPEAISGRVKFYFGDAPYPEVEKAFSIYTTSKKTNAFKKTDQEACDWAFLSAMKQFEERAFALGGNAVVEIRSVIGGIESQEVYGCNAGNLMAGVSFAGKVVKLKE